MADAILDEPPVETIDQTKGMAQILADNLKEMNDAKKAAQKTEQKTEQKVEAKVEAKAEQKVETKTEPKADEKWTSPKAADWKKLKTRAEDAETKATNFEKDLQAKLAEIDALKKEPKIDPKELETLKGERDSLIKERDTYYLAESSAFKSHFDGIFNTQIASAKEAAGAENAEQIEHLLNLPPSKKRKEDLEILLSSIPSELDKQAITRAVFALDAARTERNDALKNSSDNWAKLKLAQQQKQDEENAKRQATIAQSVEAILKAADSFDAFKPVEDDPEHNAEIPKRKQFVKDFFESKLDKKDYALTPILAQRALHLERQNAKLAAELKKTQEALAAQAQTAPDLGGKGEPAKGQESKSAFMDTFFQNWQGKGG